MVRRCLKINVSCVAPRLGQTETYKVGAAETVENGHARLAVGQDLAIFYLFEDDAVLMVEVVSRDATV